MVAADAFSWQIGLAHDGLLESEGCQPMTGPDELGLFQKACSIQKDVGS